MIRPESYDILDIIPRIIALALAIPFHEAAHALASDKLGDPLPRSQGRITLNPLKHISVQGAIFMLVLGIGWAKPVQVNPAYYKKPRLGMAITAAAGPLANLCLAFVGMLLYKLSMLATVLAVRGMGGLALPVWFMPVYVVFATFIRINIGLALFNLLPIPPLDGSRILGLVLPSKAYYAIMQRERYIMAAFFALLFLIPMLTGFSPTGWLLGGPTSAAYLALEWITVPTKQILAML